MPVELTDSGFDQEVLQSEGLVLVDFWAPWCGPCQMLGPVLDQVAQEYKDKLKICKINVDQNQAIAGRYQVLSIPTMLFFKAGKVINQTTGAKTAPEIKKTIDSLLC